MKNNLAFYNIIAKVTHDFSNSAKGLTVSRTFQNHLYRLITNCAQRGVKAIITSNTNITQDCCTYPIPFNHVTMEPYLFS